MKIGILQTGMVPPELSTRFGEYPEMMRDMLVQAQPDLTFQTWDVLENPVPQDPSACDAWLITGSRFGVYDPEPWIEPLKEFLRQVRAAQVPLIGICFGHQIMAEAFGGRAVKSDRGWGVGIHDYTLTDQPDWVQREKPDFGMYAMHQDQVVDLPDDGHVLASSDFCPIAMVAYGDPQAPDAVSIQPHPEFPPAYAEALIDMRGSVVGEERAAEARRSFAGNADGLAFARWAVDYLSAVRERQLA